MKYMILLLCFVFSCNSLPENEKVLLGNLLDTNGYLYFINNVELGVDDIFSSNGKELTVRVSSGTSPRGNFISRDVSFFLLIRNPVNFQNIRNLDFVFEDSFSVNNADGLSIKSEEEKLVYVIEAQKIRGGVEVGMFEQLGVGNYPLNTTFFDAFTPYYGKEIELKIKVSFLISTGISRDEQGNTFSNHASYMLKYVQILAQRQFN